MKIGRKSWEVLRMLRELYKCIWIIWMYLWRFWLSSETIDVVSSLLQEIPKEHVLNRNTALTRSSRKTAVNLLAGYNTDNHDNLDKTFSYCYIPKHKFMSYQVQEAEQWVCSLECEVPSVEPGLRSLWVEIWGHCPSNLTEKREILSIIKKKKF